MRVLATLLPMMTVSALLLVGCGGPVTPAPVATENPLPPTETPMPESTVVEAHVRCAEGVLTVGDLPFMDAEWAAGLQIALQKAQAWRGDARLVELQIGCSPLESGFRWNGVFYSNTAQAFFSSDTGMTTPAEIEPAAVVTLPLERISFAELHRAIAKAGFPDETPVNPTSGITVKLNAPTDPFGPPGIPNDVVVHLALETDTDVQDLFVSAANWTLYLYDNGG